MHESLHGINAIHRLVLDPIQLSDVPFGVMLAGIGGSVVVSLLAGAAPALRAARLPMREAVGGL